MHNEQQHLLCDTTQQPGKDRNVDHVTLDWIYTPPQDLMQSRYFNGRHW
jgi:hypothetical protein